MEHSMHLLDEPFLDIKSGSKTIELRLYDEKRMKIRVGDDIKFFNLKNSSNYVRKKVVGLKKFNSFEDLFEELPYKHNVYGRISITHFKEQILEIYSIEDVKKYGFLAIILDHQKEPT